MTTDKNYSILKYLHSKVFQLLIFEFNLLANQNFAVRVNYFANICNYLSIFTYLLVAFAQFFGGTIQVIHTIVKAIYSSVAVTTFNFARIAMSSVVCPVTKRIVSIFIDVQTYSMSHIVSPIAYIHTFTYIESLSMRNYCSLLNFAFIVAILESNYFKFAFFTLTNTIIHLF